MRKERKEGEIQSEEGRKDLKKSERTERTEEPKKRRKEVTTGRKGGISVCSKAERKTNQREEDKHVKMERKKEG